MTVYVQVEEIRVGLPELWGLSMYNPMTGPSEKKSVASSRSQIP